MRDERDMRDVFSKLAFFSPANSRAMGDFIPLIPLIPHIPHLSSETASRQREAGTVRLLRTLRAILIDTTRKAFSDDTPEERAARLEKP